MIKVKMFTQWFKVKIILLFVNSCLATAFQLLMIYGQLTYETLFLSILSFLCSISKQWFKNYDIFLEHLFRDSSTAVWQQEIVETLWKWIE